MSMRYSLSKVQPWLGGLLILLLAPSRLTAQDDGFQKVVAPFLKQHCYACHGPTKQESRLRLDQVTGVQAGNRNLWTLVHERVAAGEMPPEGRPQPVAAEKERFLASVRQQQRALGVSGTRRLNRRELSSALRDLTGLGIEFAYGLPGDGTVAGFDTGADGLQEASDAVAQWLVVTRRAVDGLRFLEPARGQVFTANLREAKQIKKGQDPWKKIFDDWKNQGLIVRGRIAGLSGQGLLIEPRAVGEREELSLSVPTRPDRQGVLRLTLVVSALKPMVSLPNPRLWVRIGGKDLDYHEITGTLDQPQRLVYEVQLGDLVVQAKGVTIALSNKVEIPYAVPGFENEDRSSLKDPPPGGTGLFRPLFDRKLLPPEKQPAPHIVVQTLTVEPDVVMAWPPRNILSSLAAADRSVQGTNIKPPAPSGGNFVLQDDLASARRLLGLWIDRAYRRPVTEAEQAPFLKLYAKLRGAGLSFDNAVRAAFQSVLMSAPFRYLASPAHPDPVIAQHAIASRLSFMLTGGPPDAELRRLARAGKLREPAVLDAQVDRLLDNPPHFPLPPSGTRIAGEGFFRPFVTQWLEMEQPITIAQDHIQKQDFRFARYLKASMREETLAYVTELFARNRPVRELIVSDWTMMNDALAIHYGYSGIDGGELRKVKLRPDDPRGGGILGHAGLQSMLCWMGDNWVIYRGAWTLRHILDMPPPPPPLEVPELNPFDAKNKGKSFRELLRQHQENTRCAVCHRNIDPVGFAYQNFDISGRWREVEHESYARSELDGRIAWKGVGKTRPVDSAGRLPRGEEFQTFAEFKQILVKKYQKDLVRGLLKNLFVYGVGRLPGIDDMAEITAIMKDLQPRDYPLRDLLKAIVRSRAFLEQYQPLADNQPSIGGKPQ